MKLQELRGMTEKMLKEAGIRSPASEARIIILHASSYSLSEYTLHLRDEADEALSESVLKAAARRCRMEPLQYIIGEAPFYGREFLVNPGVLIPRFDTEILVDAVLPRLADDMKILDLCTGSGCVILTLMLESDAEGLRGTGADISDTALECARRNQIRLGTETHFIKSDLFSGIREIYDVITANPPYIASDKVEGLEDEVRCYEPRSALDGGEDGLLFYRRIAEEAQGHLSQGGILALEIGYDQGETVPLILSRAGYRDIQVIKDANGRDRVVCARISRTVTND